MRTAILLLGILLIAACTTSNNVDITQYPLVLSIKDLAAYYDIQIDKSGRYESNTINQYLDGSFEIEHTYELLEHISLDPIYYSVTVSKEKTVKDAKTAFSLEKGTLNLVGNTFSQGTVVIDSLDLPGDEAFYAIRTYENEPNGMFIMIRKGDAVYSLIVSGLYTPDHSLLYDLIIPRIEDLETIKLKKTPKSSN